MPAPSLAKPAHGPQKRGHFSAILAVFFFKMVVLTWSKWAFPLRQTGGGKPEETAEDVDRSQRVRDHLFAYHLAPAMNDFISDENRE